MTRYVSTRGGVAPVDFETAVLQGFAPDGGLYVPATIPRISPEQLHLWSRLEFVDLAFEIISQFIDPAVMAADDLHRLLAGSFRQFEHPDIIPVVPLKSRPDTYIMELFHGPTLSFKDVAMGFLVNTVDYFLDRNNDWISLVVATTGDTGPAAAHAALGKKHIQCWVLFPQGMISDEQARQMTTLKADNVHAVGVTGCTDGGDDLDRVLARMFADDDLKQRLKLSSVNSINWCRVMVQAVHYFYSYFRVVEQIGEKVAFAVPTGAFGNLFGGYLARSLGLPVEAFILANNQNAALHRTLSTGRFTRAEVKPSLSSAIDIGVPYNFWRYLYFACGGNSAQIRQWMADLQQKGVVELDAETAGAIRQGFLSASVSDQETLDTMARVYQGPDGYVMDPHTAVALTAAEKCTGRLAAGTKVICLATAHAAKFPDTVKKALAPQGRLPGQAQHNTIENAKNLSQNMHIWDLPELASALPQAMQSAALYKP